MVTLELAAANSTTSEASAAEDVDDDPTFDVDTAGVAEMPVEAPTLRVDDASVTGTAEELD